MRVTINANINFDHEPDDLTDIILGALTHNRVVEVIENELSVELDNPTFDVTAVYTIDACSGEV